MPFLTRLPDGRLVPRLHVQPRASRSELTGLHGERLKLRLAAPPVEGRANEALIAFMAETLGLKRQQLELVRGLQGRDKDLVVSGLDEATVRARLLG
jgi:uncharacterized protein (TIGR00251 family)